MHWHKLNSDFYPTYWLFEPTNLLKAVARNSATKRGLDFPASTPGTSFWLWTRNTVLQTLNLEDNPIKDVDPCLQCRKCQLKKPHVY